MIKLEELKVYSLAMELGEDVWQIVEQLNSFQQSTIGKQLVRAADTDSANISEGYGRYFYKENKLFCYYSRGSLLETKTWLAKASSRQLIPKDQFNLIIQKVDALHFVLNKYIKSIGTSNSNE